MVQVLVPVSLTPHQVVDMLIDEREHTQVWTKGFVKKAVYPDIPYKQNSEYPESV